MTHISRRFSPLFLLLLSIPFARAQSSVDFGLGLGTFHDKAISGSGIEGDPNNVNYLGSCTPGSAKDPGCQSTPALSGFFMAFGGDVMASKRFGVGGEVSFQPSHPSYGPLQYRETFYDFNAIFAPVNQKKVIVKAEGGIGGARTSFALTQTGCVGTAVCTSQTQPVGNSSHFQIHVGVGVEIFVTEHLFIRPGFDLHYVPSLKNQFGSNVVPGALVWIGYSLGDR